MATKIHIAAVAAVACVIALAGTAAPAVTAHKARTQGLGQAARPATGTGSGCFCKLPAFSYAAEREASPRPRRAAYGWPIKPFARQHALRGYLNDPRIGERSKSFHFGIDVAAPNGTPVYAVMAGRVYLHNSRAVGVVGARTFEYWHIVPVVRPGQWVGTHERLGSIEKPWAHVHFAEKCGDEYVNPLRPGALGPYTDETTPTVVGVALARSGRATKTVERGDHVDIVAEAYDETPIRVQPEWWADLPVTPALLRWRVLRDANVVVCWTVGLDSRVWQLPAHRYGSVYGERTTQNHARRPGRYCFHLARSWNVGSLRPGTYTLEVEARDTAGNRAVAATTFCVSG